MSTEDHHPQHTLSGINETAIERSNQVMRQLADVGIRTGGYSLGRKLDSDTPSPDNPDQGPQGTVGQYTQHPE